jgi:hypothetical protein
MNCRLRANRMDLQPPSTRLPSASVNRTICGPYFGHRSLAPDLVNANGSNRSGQFQHDPPPYLELPVTTSGLSHGTPRFWTVSVELAERIEAQRAETDRKWRELSVSTDFGSV